MMMPRGASRASSPTDLELMLYADGELDGERLAAVEAWVERDRAARAKLAALGVVSGIVRERALGASGGSGDLTDAIMSRIDREQPAQRPAGTTPAREDLAPPGRDRRPSLRSRRRPLPRRAYVIAGAAAVAAAAVLFWSRPPAPSGAPTAHRASPEPDVTAPLLTAPDPSKPEVDIDHGVEVAAVDFGSRTGAVFYVPTETSTSSTTTVVWLSDDSAGEDQ